MNSMTIKMKEKIYWFSVNYLGFKIWNGKITPWWRPRTINVSQAQQLRLALTVFVALP